MIKVGQIVSDITANMNPFRRDMARVEKEGEQAAKNVSRSFRQMGQGMKRTGTMLTAAITAPLVGAGAMAVKTAADYEQLEVQLSNLTGSAEKGAKVFKNLQEWSAGTPFRLDSIIRANNTLIGMGQSAEDAFVNMKMLGNVASATGANITDLARIFGQASAEGRLMTRDIREFINQGVPAVKLLADSMGVAKSEIFDMASEGKISFEVMRKAIADVATEGGEWANATEDQANTLSGLWSTLRDNIDKAASEIGNSIVEAFNLKQLVRDITANIQTITKRFAALSDDTKKQVLQIVGLFAAGGPILLALGQAAIAISAFSKFVSKRFAAITASAALFAGIIEQQRQIWSKAFGDSEKEIDSFTTAARKGLQNVIGPVMDFTVEALGANKALEELQGLLSGLNGEAAKKANKVLKDTRDILSFASGDTNEFIQGLSKSAKEAENVQKKLTPFRGSDNPITGAAISAKNLTGNLSQVKTVSDEALAGMRANINPALEGMSLLEISTMKAKDELSEAQIVAQQFGQMVGNALTRAVVQGKKLGNILSSVARQLASKAIMTGLSFLLPGGPAIGGAGFFETMFGGMFHEGGIVGGNGDVPIVAQAGEGVFTKGQMKAMGGLIRNGGDSKMDEGTLQRAFDRALGKHLQKLGNDEIYAMAQKGRRSF